jgi:hypothetical protein
MDNLPTYQIFGSENSTDVDIVFFVDKIPNTIIDAANLCKQYCSSLELDYNKKKLNANLAVKQNGILKDVFKGTSDELNNALYHTYKHHQQKHEQQISRLLMRDINLKYLRCSRMILSFLTKTSFRNNIKTALDSTIQTKLEVLKNIDLNLIIDFGRNANIIEIKKTIAFQLGQTLLLNDGIEVYTKNEVADKINILKPYLLRDTQTNFNDLQQTLNTYIITLEKRIPLMNSTIEYKYQTIE